MTKFLLFFFNLCYLLSYSQPIIKWQKCFGGTNGEEATSIVTTYDSNYLIAGGTTSDDGNIDGNHGGNCGGGNCADVWVIKIDRLGNLIWQKCFGGTGSDGGYNVIQTRDSGFLISGYSTSNDGDVSGNHSAGLYRDFWIIKIDSLGTLKWQKCYGGSNNEQAQSAVELQDGSFIIAGFTSSVDGDVIGNHDTIAGNSTDYWILKVDSVGNLIWQNCYGSAGSERAYTIIKQSNNLISICGIGGDANCSHGAYDFWKIDIDTSGNLISQNCYGGPLNAQYCFAMDNANNGGAVMSGYTMYDVGDVSGFHGTSNNGL